MPLCIFKNGILFHNAKFDSPAIVDLQIVDPVTEPMQRKLMLKVDWQSICHDPAEIVCNSDGMNGLICQYQCECTRVRVWIYHGRWIGTHSTDTG